MICYLSKKQLTFADPESAIIRNVKFINGVLKCMTI